MSRKGNCYDNAVIESFHGVLKKNGCIRKNIERKKRRNPVFLNILKYFTIENAVILH
jgi:transposase InsO family protein